MKLSDYGPSYESKERQEYWLSRPLDECLSNWEYWVSKTHSTDDSSYAKRFSTVANAWKAVGGKKIGYSKGYRVHCASIL